LYLVAGEQSACHVQYLIDYESMSFGAGHAAVTGGKSSLVKNIVFA
jgi:hypothetical protein